MALTDLLSIVGELFRATKSSSANTGTTAAALTTSYADILWSGNAGINVGAAPCVGYTGAWTPGATATLVTIKLFVSNDSGATWAPAPNIPSSTSGAVTAYPVEVTFNKADWGNVATVMQISFLVAVAKGFRSSKLMAKSDSATGSPALTLQGAAGTQG